MSMSMLTKPKINTPRGIVGETAVPEGRTFIALEGSVPCLSWGEQSAVGGQALGHSTRQRRPSTAFSTASGLGNGVRSACLMRDKVMGYGAGQKPTPARKLDEEPMPTRRHVFLKSLRMNCPGDIILDESRSHAAQLREMKYCKPWPSAKHHNADCSHVLPARVCGDSHLQN